MNWDGLIFFKMHSGQEPLADEDSTRSKGLPGNDFCY